MDDNQVDIEYVYEAPEQDELFQNFAHVFDKFNLFAQTDTQQEPAKPKDDKSKKAIVEVSKKAELDTQEGPKENEDKKVSKRKLKQMTRMTVADLKQQVNRPELVELHDITAKDPLFLLCLKSTKNSVPVPRHWSSKRRYLQGKRGYEKPPFQLPKFIVDTNIMEMRDSTQEKESNKSLKARTRERVQPKMSKTEICYQLMHDAFFKNQTKPKLTIHGDLYYEGKEFEKKFKKKAGELSDDLRRALGMPTGPSAHRYPPPWLPNMRRHGAPPSYPWLKIPGVNCPYIDDNEVPHSTAEYSSP